MVRFREIITWVIVAIIFGGVIAAAAYVIVPKFLQPKSELLIGNGVFNVTVTRDPSVLTSGKELGVNQARIVEYPGAYTWPVKTDNLQKAVDLVWLDEDKQVVYIVKNITPEPAEDTTYQPNKPSNYVLELPVGTVEGKAINIGQTARFDASAKVPSQGKS